MRFVHRSILCNLIDLIVVEPYKGQAEKFFTGRAEAKMFRPSYLLHARRVEYGSGRKFGTF
jgi:hypothetical protein